MQNLRLTAIATDASGNVTTNQYNVVASGNGSESPTYDANGNLKGDGTRTFEWDPLDRLTAVNIGTHRSEFTYNGLGQRVSIVEKDNGTVTSTTNLIWCLAEICEQRDANNNVTPPSSINPGQVLPFLGGQFSSVMGGAGDAANLINPPPRPLPLQPTGQRSQW